MERLAGRVILLWGWRRALAAFGAGAAAALAQAPFDFFAICFLSFPIIVWLLDGAHGRTGEGMLRRLSRPFMIGWWFGFGYFLVGLWWIGNALLVEADQFAWALPFAVLGLPALLAIFYGLATAMARLLWSDGIGRVAALALGFGIAEWLRATVLTGFPWNAIGHAAMPVPVLMQSLHALGAVAIDALAVFVFAMPALLAAPSHRRLGLSLAVLLAAAHVGFGWWRIDQSASAPDSLVMARIVQPSIDQSEKWDRDARERIFQTYLDLSARPPTVEGMAPALIVWPETSVPFLFTDRPDALTALGELIETGQLLLAGAVRVEGNAGAGASRYYNSLLTIDHNGEIIDAVDKVHLVPFGEYMPLAELFRRVGVEKLVQSVASFSPGAARRPIGIAEGVTALPFICYEVIFPGVAGYGEITPDLLVNVTNDAWFGDTPGPYQHFRQAQLRAVEAGRPLLRSANNGISGVVDAYGRVVDALAVDAVGLLDVAIPQQRLHNRFLAGPYGNGILILALLALTAAAMLIGSRKAPN